MYDMLSHDPQPILSNQFSKHHLALNLWSVQQKKLQDMYGCQ
jgi:hypothetical protein